MSDIADRLALLKSRIRSAYDGIGHSHGRPYIYFVYPPEQDPLLRRLIVEELVSSQHVAYILLDVLTIVLQSTNGQETKRESLLADPIKSSAASASLFRLWARSISKEIYSRIHATPHAARPVVILYGLAAIHPLGTPTAMMEAIAEQEPRNPVTGNVLPIVLFVPGIRPPQTSREYLFLGQERLRQSFYRGEEA